MLSAVLTDIVNLVRQKEGATETEIIFEIKKSRKSMEFDCIRKKIKKLIDKRELRFNTDNKKYYLTK